MRADPKLLTVHALYVYWAASRAVWRKLRPCVHACRQLDAIHVPTALPVACQ